MDSLDAKYSVNEEFNDESSQVKIDQMHTKEIRPKFSKNACARKALKRFDSDQRQNYTLKAGKVTNEVKESLKTRSIFGSCCTQSAVD